MAPPAAQGCENYITSMEVLSHWDTSRKRYLKQNHQLNLKRAPEEQRNICTSNL